MRMQRDVAGEDDSISVKKARKKSNKFG